MNLRVKRLALFISFSAACLGSSYSAMAADSAASDTTAQTERARPPLDFTPPVVTLNGDAVMSLYQGTTYLDPGATAIDAVDGPIRVTVRGTPIMSRPGTYTITYSAVDKRGNKGTAKRTVHVIADTLAPVITLNGLSTMSILQGNIFEDLGATATDNLDGEVAVKVIGKVRRNIPGIYTLTYVAKDEAGNEARVTRTVTVIADTVPPQLTLNGSDTITLTKGTAFNDPGAQATDNSDAPVNIRKYGRVNTDRLGTYLVKYQARDGAGNLSTILTRTVIVVASTPTDTIAPVITLNGPTSIELTVGGTYNEQGATATDNVDGTVTVTVSGSVNTATAGTYTITYRATDKAGNTATATRTVIVKVADTTKPVITLNGAASLELTVGGTYTELGATATDDVDGTVTVTVSGSVNTATAGTYTITYTASDKAGNTATATRTVVVKVADTTKPIITLNGAASVELTVGGTYTELGATATDDVDGTVTVTISGSVNTATAGTYTLTYTATDKAGNTATATRTVVVKVVDTTKPVITLNGAASLELTVGGTYTELGATATDDVDGTVTVTVSGSVNTATAGTYTLTYTATDKAGNTATATRTVIVTAANVAPTANAGSDQTVNELTTVTLNGSGADTDGSIVSYAWVQVSGPEVTLSQATQAQASFTAPDVTANTALSFKLTVTDDKGATAEDSVIITVVPVVSADTIPPVITLKGLDKIYYSFNPDYPYEDQGATAIDNIDGEVSVIKSGDTPNGLGIYTITYTASDAAHNEATKSRVVKVVDSVPLDAYISETLDTMELETVTLDGSYSSADSENGYEIISYEWKQTKGTPVTFSNPSSAVTSFVAPDITSTETLEFMLIVTDNFGFKASTLATVKVTPLLSPTPKTTGRLNDTGLTQCQDNSNTPQPCPVVSHPNQDADTGRDITNNDSTDGRVGFSFTKLDAQGVALTNQTGDYTDNPWSCVKDNVTGLIWEVKTEDGGIRDADWTYNWYDQTSDPNECTSPSGFQCDAITYKQLVNESGLCNANDWRLPTGVELMSLVDYGRNPADGLIDPGYFPFMKQPAYWTSELSRTQGQYSFYAWSFNNSLGSLDPWSYPSFSIGVILVRGKK